MTKFLTATVAILIAAVIGLGYVVFFYEAHDKAHTQDLNEDMVLSLMYDHIYGLVAASGVTEESDDDDWAALLGIGCFWEKGESYHHLNAKLYSSEHELMTWNYVDTRDIWLITSTAHNCESNYLADMLVYDGPELATWTMDDNTGEVTYGRPDYDLYESERPVERPVEASGNQPPSSEDICASAKNALSAMSNDTALELRTETVKTMLAHACF